MRRRSLELMAVVGWLGLLAPPVGAQALGTFRWQLQPYCNVLTLSVQQDGAVYTLDGFDDQCGASSSAASVVGTAFLNPDGTIGFGVNGSVAPGAAPVMLYARVTLATVSGTWSDSAGNSGAFVFTPGPGTGSAVRPVPTNGIAPASITSAQLAPGAVGAAQIAVGSVTAAQIALGSLTGAQISAAGLTGSHFAVGTITSQQLAPGTVQAPIVGTCPVGQYLRGVTSGGAVTCEPFAVPAYSATVDDPANQVGSYSSMAIGTDGLPVISHTDQTAFALRVTKCGNAACTTGNSSTTVDDPLTLSVGTYTSIAIPADGLPVISHWDFTALGLRVTKCGNASCTSGNVSTTVDDPPTLAVGTDTSMAIGSDGLPIISHRDTNAEGLRVTKCGNADCTMGNISTTVDDVGNQVGFFTSIAIGMDGLPIISHQDATAGALRVTRCGNISCTSGNVSTNVDAPASSVGSHTSIVIGADGLPIISHRDATADGLRVTHCTNAACTAGTSTTVDAPGAAVGYFTSIAIGADGAPTISHQDATTNALRVTKCGNAACTAGTVSTAVDGQSNVGAFTSLVIGTDGLPLISHRDTTAGTLRVTKCGSQSCR